MVPLIVLMVPLYVLFRRYGLLNSLSGVIAGRGRLPASPTPSSSWSRTSPRCRSELEDAARIDGCTRFTAFCA